MGIPQSPVLTKAELQEKCKRLAREKMTLRVPPSNAPMMQSLGAHYWAVAKRGKLADTEEA